MSDETMTNVRVAKRATTSTTSHTPVALEMTVTIEPGQDGEWAALVIEWSAPKVTRPVGIALTD